MTARRRYAFAAVIAAVAAAVPLAASPAPAHAAPDAKPAFTFTDSRIDTSAGLAVLADEPGYVFTINDHTPTRVFGVDPSSGHSAATMRLRDASVVDWEAIAPGQGRNLWVGDIGGSNGARQGVTVYKFHLPSQLSTGYYSSKKYRLTYPDGPHDAQALLVNPSDGTMYVATYGSSGGGLYAARNLSTGGTKLQKVGSVPANVTDGAYSPDGKQFVLRTPDKAYVYSAPGKQVGTIAMPQQRQGKGIAYTPNGKALLLSGAGANSQVLRMKVSGALVASTGTPSPASSASPSEASGSSDNGGLVNLAFIIGPFVIAGIAVLLALILRKRTSGYEGGHGGGAGSRDLRRYERDEPYPPPSYGGRGRPEPPQPPPPPPPQQQPHDPRYEPAYDRYGDESRPDVGGGRAAGPRRSAGRPRRPRRGRGGDDSVPFWLQD